MKGQYRIIFEVILILAGILMTSYVASNFGNIQEKITEISAYDNFNMVANNMLMGLVKASANNGTIVRVVIPEKIADQVYKISIDGSTNLLSVESLANKPVNVTREIFNIGQANRVIKSEVVSSAHVVEIISDDGFVKLRRGIYRPNP